MFEIGQKIVCVDDARFPLNLVPDWYSGFPVKDSVYTVRDITPAGHGLKAVLGSIANSVGVLLVEIRNPINPQGTENAYSYARFRPLDELPEKRIAVEDRELVPA